MDTVYCIQTGVFCQWKVNLDLLLKFCLTAKTTCQMVRDFFKSVRGIRICYCGIPVKPGMSRYSPDICIQIGSNPSQCKKKTHLTVCYSFKRVRGICDNKVLFSSSRKQAMLHWSIEFNHSNPSQSKKRHTEWCSISLIVSEEGFEYVIVSFPSSRE